MKLALGSFDELTEAYQTLEYKFRELQAEHEKLLKWLIQGSKFVKANQDERETS